MKLVEIGGATSWNSAFEVARQLLADGKLTDIAFVDEETFNKGNYFGITLQEFAEKNYGTREAALEMSAETVPLLYPQATSFRLMHGAFKPVSPFHDFNLDAWMLTVVYSPPRAK